MSPSGDVKVPRLLHLPQHDTTLLLRRRPSPHFHHLLTDNIDPESSSISLVEQSIITSMSLLHRLHSWSHDRRERRRRSDANELSPIPIRSSSNRQDESIPPILPPSAIRRPLTPSSAPGAAESAPAFAAQPSPFFTLPFELRRQIFLYAFGRQTLHIDLAFRRPFAPAPLTTPEKERPHAHIFCDHMYFHSGQGFRRITVDKSSPKAWRWFGCVCHARAADVGSFDPSLTEVVDLSTDGCLTGRTDCDAWPGEWPGRCFVGVMGWLLSCRQAYVEGVHVLYSTNIIHISSNLLIQRPDAFLPAQRLAQITSLRFRWSFKEGHENAADDAALSNMAQSNFSRSYLPPSSLRGPVCPALKYLHISLEGDFMGLYAKRDDEGRVPFDSPREGAQAMREKLQPALDEVVQRFATPLTECVVTIPWSSYETWCLLEGDVGQPRQTSRASWRVVPRVSFGFDAPSLEITAP
ncbi:hypothetical protein BN1708_001610 [Verticillium longisporum]|uniref:DUF7730 domain-containing protein n=1 Tax=Verticillium longisporum TaxID=100787 RepID=A0A0G4MYW5_VERLO|nr:hypothetical protein BN1708_001610 [Verticillium longisporum]